MTGYTVHTGANDKFRDGWDNIFSKPKSKTASKKKAATKNKAASKKKAAAKKTKKK
ncbi:hypothetical protein KOR42_35910 [Thalassoglobus neptunius]|uniref:Uncharacterized protein n=1 Tax=Thalassoglobus neptunius TaxID=1938619 RepID=A0A5C5WNF3_9PLAN|nr:hypothetical protein [Thalassoglobus neptunius]TWT51543.1 hypothetical protein KOR42_35910 [Thalassoglobus neptunius]